MWKCSFDKNIWHVQETLTCTCNTVTPRKLELASSLQNFAEKNGFPPWTPPIYKANVYTNEDWKFSVLFADTLPCLSKVVLFGWCRVWDNLCANVAEVCTQRNLGIPFYGIRRKRHCDKKLFILSCHCDKKLFIPFCPVPPWLERLMVSTRTWCSNFNTRRMYTSSERKMSTPSSGKWKAFA